MCKRIHKNQCPFFQAIKDNPDNTFDICSNCAYHKYETKVLWKLRIIFVVSLLTFLGTTYIIFN